MCSREVWCDLCALVSLRIRYGRSRFHVLYLPVLKSQFAVVESGEGIGTIS